MHFDIKKIHKNYKLWVTYNKEYGISYYQLKKLEENQGSPQNYAKIGQKLAKIGNN